MNKKNPVISFTLVLLLLVTIISCKKNELGGDATIVVFVKHNGTIIPNQVGYLDTVFVKFNATESPGTSPGEYDTYFVGELGKDHVTCRGFRKGLYFFYAVGMDSAGPYRVKGGKPLEIKWVNRKAQQDVDILVAP